MNIKNRLILSHILTFFIPIVMTFFVLLLCAGGLALFAQSGHHIYAENVNQFQRITMVLHHVVFRNLRSHPDGNLSDIWLLGLLDPDYNCIMVNREGQVIYTYGNQFLAKRRHRISSKSWRPWNRVPGEYATLRPQRRTTLWKTGCQGTGIYASLF